MRRRFSFLLVSALLAAVFGLSSCQGIRQSPNPGGPGDNRANQLQTASPIKHVIVVVMQNHSFDNLFGKYPGDVNGIRSGVPGYTQKDASGADHTPILLRDDIPDLPHSRQRYVQSWNNGAMDQFIVAEETTNALGYYDDSNPGVAQLWSLAQQYALADKFFAAAMAAAPTNPLYMVSASDNDYPYSVMPIYGPCNQQDINARAYTYRNLGDQLQDANIPWGWYQENYGDCGNYVPQENPFQYFTSTHDSPNVTDYLNFRDKLDVGQTDAVSFIQIGPAKTTHPGAGPISVGLAWLTTFVDRVKNSADWNTTAIVVLWDEPGGFWDHVPPRQVDSQGFGFRVPMMVISPFAKTNYVSHVEMDTTSILKFIHWNWNINESLGPRESNAGDMRDMFNFNAAP